MQANSTISLQTFKVAPLSMVGGFLLFGLAPILGINIHLEKAGGLVLGLGIISVSLAFGFGSRLKAWMLSILAVIGSFLLLLGGTAVIR